MDLFLLSDTGAAIVAAMGPRTEARMSSVWQEPEAWAAVVGGSPDVRYAAYSGYPTPGPPATMGPCTAL